MEDACIARILETRCYSKSGIPWPFVDRSIRREFFGGEIDNVFAARGGGFLRVTWLLSPSLSLSACALCHAWVVYAWFIVVSYDENIRERSSSKESDEFGSPLRDMGHARSIFIYIYTFFFILFLLLLEILGRATRVSWYDSIGDYSYFEYDFVQGRILYKLRWVHGFE